LGFSRGNNEIMEKIKIPCDFCGKPMLVAFKTIAFWHKECRKEGRRLKRKREKETFK